jgi:L-threonylcarbamoyladenylate synthase
MWCARIPNMRTFPKDSLHSGSPDLQVIADVLDAGGLVCMPHNAGYRLMADLTNQDAVIGLLQAKRRTKHAPSLIFLDSLEHIDLVADDFGPRSRSLAEAFWPGPVTMLVKPSSKLPKTVVKELSKANKHLGVRVPAETLIREVIALLGRPVVASSANRQKKNGQTSSGAVRQHFGRALDLFVEAGDLDRQAPKSTVVCLDNGQIEIKRPGAISLEQLTAALREDVAA